ncbi:guided entry of tail-anchored proteins factor 1-like isoform X1 [Schistocerca gregaria]|uniref:guided entry of tail-anchored proteins factor 1-like isoform X1 n=2 Tax=Schistocerca gregaria TaxID=7010 RepID=UPI00211F207B|nr:guided entry of tail-anchored proteins factor 1-like isoform X1 [Schistocerca gregaria]
MYILLSTTCICFINAFLPVIVRSLLSCICVASAHERELKAEEAHVKAELAAISMIDEFAKYARTQRKLNKIQNELKTVAASRLESQAKTKIAVLYAAQFVLGIITCCFVWMYKHVPVATFPPNWMKPFGAFLSWPSGIDGGISIVIWLFCVGHIARKAAKQFSI